jgi:LysR family transcriptional activator of nhaA
MLRINLQQLYYFWMVAHERSFTRASQKLFLTQPAVSSQVRGLEKKLGLELFERGNRRLVLSAEGRHVLGYANDIFDVAGDLIESLSGESHRKNPRIRLGINNSITKEIASKCLHLVDKFHHGTALTIRQGSAQDLIRDLRDRHLDLVLSDEPARRDVPEDYKQVLVGRLPVFFVAAPSIARTVRRFPRDLSHTPLLLPNATNPLRMAMDVFLLQSKVQPELVSEIADAELMHQLALEGRGVAALHGPSLAADLRSGRLVRLGRGSTGLSKAIWLISIVRKREHLVVKNLLKHFRLV